MGARRRWGGQGEHLTPCKVFCVLAVTVKTCYTRVLKALALPPPSCKCFKVFCALSSYISQYLCFWGRRPKKVVNFFQVKSAPSEKILRRPCRSQPSYIRHEASISGDINYHVHETWVSVLDMTYNVFGGTLNLTQSINHETEKHADWP